jgi:branched-chain amino acid aminotransferase
MENFAGKYFINNGELENIDFFPVDNDNKVIIYEVIRILNGVPLFYEEHYYRLINSVYLAGYDYKNLPDKNLLKENIIKLIKSENILNGNIKLGFSFIKGKFISYKIYFINHKYPKTEDYEFGVKLISVKAERKQPNIKIRNKSLRTLTDEIINQHNVFEVVLINEKGLVTEGSRSNIFFIKSNEIYSAKSSDILKGITWNYVKKIAEKNKINFIEKDIQYSDIIDYESCFITGTSPKILPVSELDNITYNVNNNLIKIFMNDYEEIIQQYLVSNK